MNNIPSISQLPYKFVQVFIDEGCLLLLAEGSDTLREIIALREEAKRENDLWSEQELAWFILANFPVPMFIEDEEKPPKGPRLPTWVQ